MLENPEKRRRKSIFPNSCTIESAGNTETNMASSTGKSSGQEQKSKDSPKPNKPPSGGPFGNNPGFTGFPIPPGPPGPTLFGAPTYLPNNPNNPWQTEQANKLDFIVEKLTKIEQNQDSFLIRIGVIENKLTETNIKVNEIEKSQSHISHKYDTIDSTTKENKQLIHKLQGDVKSLQNENKTLSDQNVKLQDDVIDLKCRSMRDNLLFFGIPEVIAPEHVGDVNAAGIMEHSDGQEQQVSTENTEIHTLFQNSASSLSFAETVQKEESCADKVYEFCEKVLNIKDVRSCIKIDRAHRIGARSAGKTRPIVVKFLMSEHKDIVKSALRNVDLKTAFKGAFKVNDQFPPEVIQRRRELIPRLISERKKGNKAALVRDKLYINNKLAE